MRTFAQALKAHGADVVEALAEIGAKSAVRRTSVGTEILCPSTGLSDAARALLKRVNMLSFIEQYEIYVMSQIVHEGPKVFRPTAEQLAYLELMDLNIEVRDFHTPYRVFVVELPADYAQVVNAVNPIDGAVRHPDFCIMFMDRAAQMLGFTCVLEHDALKSWWAYESEDTPMERWWERTQETADVLASSESEREAERRLRRAVCNYCLLLDEVGTRRVGPAVPNEYAQLAKWAAKSNKHTKRNKVLLQAQPVIHALDREVKLVVHERQSSSGAEPTGKHTAPHTRRGHYRMQVHGEGRALRKRIRIPPVFVNAHLLAGQARPTAAYKT